MAAAVESRLAVPVVKKRTVPHDLIRNQLNTLLENEIQYKKQIRDMEKDTIELSRAYDAVYEENKTLRSLVEHGPDTAKIAQLSDENNKVKKENQRLTIENKALKTKVKGLEQQLSQPLEDELDRQWNNAVATARKRRELLEAAVKKARTVRPVKDGDVLRSAILRELEEEQEMSLRIDTLEKEIHILQNNVKKMKMEWEHICFSRAKDKGSMTRNEAVTNAINEKLTRDIYRFEQRLNKLKKKHTSMISEQDEMLKRNPIQERIPEEDVTESQEETEKGEDTPLTQEKKAKTYKTKKKPVSTISGRSKLPQLATKQSTFRSTKSVSIDPTPRDVESLLSADEDQTAKNKQLQTSPDEKITDDEQSNSPTDGKALELSVLTRQELAEKKAVMRRQKREELESKKILPPPLPPRSSKRLKKLRDGVLPRSRYLRPKLRADLYKYALNRSLDDISKEQTGSPIPINFKEMDKFVKHDEVKLILKRWDRPVYEPVKK